MKYLFTLSLVFSVVTAHAQPTLDGNAGAGDGYGAALSVQNTDTGFGNNTDSNLLIAGGSEINQVFGTVVGDRLYMTITGNLETNFNKLTLFFDGNDSTGVNTLDGPNLPDGFDPFCGRCGGGFEIPRGENPVGDIDGGLQNMNGLTFDAGFTADYALVLTHGIESVDDNSFPVEFYALTAHYADLTQGGAGASQGLGMILAPQGTPNVLRAAGDGLGDVPLTPGGVDGVVLGPALPNLGAGELIDRDYALSDGGCTDDSGAGCLAPELEFALDVNPAEQGLPFPEDNNGSDHRNLRNIIDLEVAVDNSNVGGVEGFLFAGVGTIGTPEVVTTGIEFSIPLSALGSPSGDIKVAGFVNGGDYDFASNQFIGVGVDVDNLGSNGTSGFVSDQLDFDLGTFAGDQFVTIANTGSEPLPGDANNDGAVDLLDLDILGSNFGITEGGTFADGDFNGDGAVDLLDLDILGANFGTMAGGSAVPEPTAAVLAALALAGVARRR